MRAQPLVCGSDGNTYMGSCLALCQGVRVARAGPCSPRDAGLFDPKLLAANAAAAVPKDKGTVPPGVLVRCVQQGGGMGVSSGLITRARHAVIRLLGSAGGQL